MPALSSVRELEEASLQSVPPTQVLYNRTLLRFDPIKPHPVLPIGRPAGRCTLRTPELYRPAGNLCTMAQASLLTGRCIPTLPCKARSSRPQVHPMTGQGLAGLTLEVHIGRSFGQHYAWLQRQGMEKACCGAPVSAVLAGGSRGCHCAVGTAAASVALVHSSPARVPGSLCSVECYNRQPAA